MGFWETTGKVVGFVADDMAHKAEQSARNKKVFNEEQRETYRNMANGLRNVKEKTSDWSKYDH